jgi:signal peptidase I
MRPTINGEFVLVNNFIYTVLRKKPLKGEVVTSLTPDGSFKLVCKRIGAIEGETVEYVNSEGKTMTEVVPLGHVWLLGDNPDLSIDSRSYGPVKTENIRGQVLLTLNNLKCVR